MIKFSGHWHYSTLFSASILEWGYVIKSSIDIFIGFSISLVFYLLKPIRLYVVVLLAKKLYHISANLKLLKNPSLPGRGIETIRRHCDATNI